MENNNEYEQVELDVVTLTDEDGQDHDFAIDLVFELNNVTYVALCPVLEGDIVDGEEVIFYRYAEEGDEVILDDLDDEEAELVAAEYETLCSEDELS